MRLPPLPLPLLSLISLVVVVVNAATTTTNLRSRGLQQQACMCKKGCNDYAPVNPDPAWFLSSKDIWDSPETTFPPGFEWGTATAAYQIEGKGVGRIRGE